MVFNFDKQFLKYFDKPFVVGVSGGADSIFLLYQIIKYFQDEKKNTDLITVCTLNHGVRVWSESDCFFVKNICEKNGIECVIKNRNSNDEILFDVDMKEDEKTLRLRRHQQFINIVKEKNAQNIFLWHNLTDRFETTILNMWRWCAKSGLLWIKPIDNHFLNQTIKIVRPLIFLPKEKIFKYCEVLWIEYVSDDTNFDSWVSKRNFVRNEIFPFFGQISNKKSNWDWKFWDSVKRFYENLEQIPIIPLIRGKISGNTNQVSSLEKGRLGGVCLQSIYLVPEWEAEWGYEINYELWITNYELQIEEFIQIAKKLWFYKNVSNNVLDEIVNFLNNSKSWYKYRNGVWFFVSHGKQYLIKNIKKSLFWERTVGKTGLNWNWQSNLSIQDKIEIDWEDRSWIVRYPNVWDKFKWKTLNKYLINKKIPIFYRSWVKVYEKDGKIKRVDCELWNK